MTVLSVWPLGMALNAKMPQVFAVWGPNWPKRVWGLGHLPLWGACVGSVGHAKAGHFVTPVTCKKVVLTLGGSSLVIVRALVALVACARLVSEGTGASEILNS
jgi:hypothetical protein